MIPLIALVGRPNVGKSTLFNRLTRSRKALVDNQPGVTRDRHYATADWNGRAYRLVDTGGLEAYSTLPSLSGAVRQQSLLAVAEADLILFMTDARSGLSSDDLAIAQQLRLAGKPVLCIANKAEGRGGTLASFDFCELGFDTVLAISAAHGEGITTLMTAVWRYFPDVDKSSDVPESPQPSESDPSTIQQQPAVRLAVVGCPNVGKSSLVNRLVGEQRMLASDLPGTTRDSIDVPFTASNGQPFVLVDTAGIRRKSRISLRLEKFTVTAALRTIERADVVVLVLDATRGVNDQEQQIASEVIKAARPMLLLVNKWDCMPRDKAHLRQFSEALQQALPRFSHAPTLFVSAQTGRGVEQILPQVVRLRHSACQRISTGILNRWLEEVLQQHPPPRTATRPLKMRYLSQVSVDPPTLAFFVNLPDQIPDSYQRYLENQLRQRFGFAGVPLRLLFRGKDNPYHDKDHPKA
ncbi:MAG: ribosome biogenesis GTPase Der [Magnetococcales bacterium]|nr:ribosome biogenesis GTPase Der [Magnetococcales bacterium]